MLFRMRFEVGTRCIAISVSSAQLSQVRWSVSMRKFSEIVILRFKNHSRLQLASNMVGTRWWWSRMKRDEFEQSSKGAHFSLRELLTLTSRTDFPSFSCNNITIPFTLPGWRPTLVNYSCHNTYFTQYAFPLRLTFSISLCRGLVPPRCP
jgi:hypothetical protein